jgi:hypothetical protein
MRVEDGSTGRDENAPTDPGSKSGRKISGRLHSSLDFLLKVESNIQSFSLMSL